MGHLTQAVLVTGGTLDLEGAVIDCLTGDGIVCSGGTVNLRNCRILTHGGGKVDIAQSGGGVVNVSPGCTGSGANGNLVTSGSVNILAAA